MPCGLFKNIILNLFLFFYSFTSEGLTTHNTVVRHRRIDCLAMGALPRLQPGVFPLSVISGDSIDLQ